MLHDYFKLRAEMNLAGYPDDMVHDTARDVELRCLEAGVRAGDLAWLVESARRSEPRSHQAVVTDAAAAREG